MPKFTYGQNKQADERVESLLRNEILCCVSSMVTYILGEDDSNAPFDQSDIENLWPDFSTWDFKRCYQWIFENVTHADIDEIEGGIIPCLLGFVVDLPTAEAIKSQKWGMWQIADWLNHHAPEVDYSTATDDLQHEVEDRWREPEVYEWWAVSSWLFEALRDLGEVVIDTYPQLWGRQCTGQSIQLDSTLYAMLDHIGWEPEEVQS